MGLEKWIVILVLSSSYVSTSKEPSNESRFVNATNCFSINLISKLKSQDGNLICSPLSANIVLSMLQMGAKGPTYDELSQALQYQSNGLSDDDVQHQMQTQLQSLYETQEVTLTIVNSMWIEKEVAVMPSYKGLISERFLVTEENLDFLNNAHAATDTINQWVNEKTNSLIPNLFSDDLDSDTNMVLVNAIYFKGSWENPFDVRQTKTAPFRNNNNQSEIKMVSLMNQKNSFRYKKDEDLQAQIIELEYKGSAVSLFVILPDDEVNLEDMEPKLDCTKINEVLKLTATKEVNLTLPKMDMESCLELEQPLRDLKINSIFDSADLSLISKEHLHVTKIVQKARIKVYEDGSEASGATGVVLKFHKARRGPEEVIQFNADHPFLYYVVHKGSGQIIFAGRVNQL